MQPVPRVNVDLTAESCQSSLTDIDIILSAKPKSCSLDPLPTWLLKNFIYFLLPNITTIMNLSLEKGFFLLISRSRLSVLLSRKKLLTPTSLILGNYRPISNLSFLSKALERIVASQIDEYLHVNGLYANFRQWIQPVFISFGVNAAGKSAELARSLGLTDYLPSGSNNSPKSGEGLFYFKPVSCSEVREVLTVMPSNKAPGYERIPLFVIKDCLPYILPTLIGLINSSFACSEFPRAWKKSVIVPHLKDGGHVVPNNNRPISLLPVHSKVAEKTALIQFNDFLTKQDILTQHHSGNRKNHSTETLSLLVTDHIFRAIDQQQLTAMVLIDRSKAFDSICHSTLLRKLRSLGTSSQALKWFQSYLTDHSIRHLSIWWAYDNTWRVSRLHLRSHVVQLIYKWSTLRS